MKSFLKCQIIQAVVILFVFLVQNEPGGEVAAIRDSITIGLLAAVALTTTCSAKESVKNQVRQAVTLGSVALAAGLGLLAIHLGIAVQGWLVFFGLALLAVGYISMPYRTKWAPAISVGAQLTILGVGMYLIALQ